MYYAITNRNLNGQMFYFARALVFRSYKCDRATQLRWQVVDVRRYVVA